MYIYRTIHMILQYDMIHTIHTLYCTIHEHLHTLLQYETFYTRYETYRTILTTMGLIVILVKNDFIHFS